MKIPFYKIILCLFISHFAFANGGPVDMSHFRKTGNIRLLRNADISLLKEDLQIKVIGDYTEIKVEYILQNNGEIQAVQYGFPVDAYETNWGFGDVYPVFSKENDCLKSFEAWNNEEAIKINQWIIDSVYQVKTVNLRENSNYHNRDYSISRKWSAMTLKFEKNEVKTLKIHYKIKNTLRDKMPGFCYVDRYTDRHFMYHLTPSSKWGNGIVNDFSVTIDLSDLAENNCGFSVLGLDNLQEQNNIYTFSTTNYDLKKSDRINIHYDNRHLKMTSFINKFGYSNQVINSIKSSANNLTIKNLIDGNPNTNWIGKQGDWIEITFKSNINIAGILLLNGDYSNEENFKNSGKITRSRVIVNDENVFNTTPWEGETEIIKLKASLYRSVKEDNIKGLSTILADGTSLYFSKNSMVKTAKIRIEIIGANGDNNKATISELFFVGKAQ